jgi:hypothetical protein
MWIWIMMNYVFNSNPTRTSLLLQEINNDNRPLPEPTEESSRTKTKIQRRGFQMLRNWADHRYGNAQPPTLSSGSLWRKSCCCKWTMMEKKLPLPSHPTICSTNSRRFLIGPQAKVLAFIRIQSVVCIHTLELIFYYFYLFFSNFKIF